jgi:hypothetical protein
MTRPSAQLGPILQATGWTLVVLGGLLTFGFIGFGPPLILAGFLCLLIRRQRVLPSTLQAVVMGLIAGVIGWYCLIPLGCTSRAIRTGFPDVAGTTTCTTLFNLTPPGDRVAVAAGCLAAIVVAVVSARLGRGVSTRHAMPL